MMRPVFGTATPIADGAPTPRRASQGGAQLEGGAAAAAATSQLPRCSPTRGQSQQESASFAPLEGGAPAAASPACKRKAAEEACEPTVSEAPAAKKVRGKARKAAAEAT